MCVNREKLTAPPPRLQTIIHVVAVIRLLDAQHNQIGEIAVEIDFLARKRGFLYGFGSAREHDARGSGFDCAAGHGFCFWLCGGGARGGELG